MSEKSELDFEAGMETGVQETIEGVEQRLIDAGHDPEEIEELLYDPAPRRKRGRRKARAAPRQYRSYDPAAKKRKVTARHHKKGMLAKLKPYVLPGTAGVTFYTAYLARATELFNAGSITKNDVFLAIQYDITHFNSTDAMARVQANAFTIGAPAVGGFLINTTKILGKHSGIVADLLYGFAAGTGAKVILDPPYPQTQNRIRQPTGTVRVLNSTQTQCGCTATKQTNAVPSAVNRGGYGSNGGY